MPEVLLGRHVGIRRLHCSPKIQGVMLGLRGNTKGDVFSMIAVVRRSLSDDAVIWFKKRGGTTPFSTSYVNRVVEVNLQECIACTVAV